MDDVRTSKQIGIELCEALGIPPERVLRIGLDLTGGKAACLQIEYVPSKDEWGRVIAIIQKYFPVTV